MERRLQSEERAGQEAGEEAVIQECVMDKSQSWGMGGWEGSDLRRDLRTVWS